MKKVYLFVMLIIRAFLAFLLVIVVNSLSNLWDGTNAIPTTKILESVKQFKECFAEILTNAKK